MKYKKGDKFKIEGELVLKEGGLTMCPPYTRGTGAKAETRTEYNAELLVNGRNLYVTEITDRDLDHLEKIEPEIDWDEVKEDTPIWVRNSIADAWMPRHFAYYDDDGGYVYCWDDGCTSHTATLTTAWLYARLMEDE